MRNDELEAFMGPRSVLKLPFDYAANLAEMLYNPRIPYIFSMRTPLAVVRILTLPGNASVLLIPLIILTGLALAGMQFVNGPLETEIAPAGLISMALSGDPQTIAIIRTNWTELGLIPQAFFALGLMFLAVVSLSITLFFGCIWSSQKSSLNLWADIGVVSAWAQWAGGLYGCATGVAIGFFLGGRMEPPLPSLAFTSNILYMVVLFLGVLYSTAGFVVRELPKSAFLRR